MKISKKLTFITISLITASQVFAGGITNTLSEETDSFSIQQADKHLLNINANGKIGMGIEKAKTALHIKNNNAQANIRLENQDDSFNLQVKNKKLTISSTEKCSQNDSDANMLGNQLIIDSAGHIGVNTPNPLAELHISSALRGTAACEKSSSGEPASIILKAWTFTSYADAPSISENRPPLDTERLSIRGSKKNEILTLTHKGNIGIDETNPIVKLEVKGGVKISTSTCNINTIGTIQYDATENKFQGCISTDDSSAKWVDLHQ